MYKEAVSCPDGPLWNEAIKGEIDSILQNICGAGGFTSKQ